MAVLSLEERLEQVAEYLQWMLKVNCPKDTTNLSNNINIEYTEKGMPRIVIGNEENADYAVYTNEPWTSDRWDGKQNPNEGWVDRTIAESTSMIQQIMSGEIPEDEFNELVGELKNEYDAQVDEIINEIDNELNSLRGGQ